MNTVLDPTKKKLSNPERIIHLTYDMKRGLCGAKINGNLRPGEPVECHVCAELWGRR